MSIVGAFAVPHPPILLPEIGGHESEKISKTAQAYAEVARRIASLNPDTILIISPHSVMYSDYIKVFPGTTASGDFSRFRVPELKFNVSYDLPLAEEIVSQAEKAALPAGFIGNCDPSLDHGTMIPMYFIQRELTDTPIIRVGISDLPAQTHFSFGECIAQAAQNLNRRLVVVASGDLSHKLKDDGPYGYSPDSSVFDQMICTSFSTGDFKPLFALKKSFCESAAECGLRSFIIMAGAIATLPTTPELLSYEGPFGVGYVIASFIPCDPYVQLARLTVETYVKETRRVGKPSSLPEKMLNLRAGTFVSIHKDGQLRGCIGTIAATEPSIADEIISNAISACSRDPRFEMVQESELDRLVYNVDVLGPYEEINSPEELDPKRYGVIVATGARRGLLLPNLEGVDTVQQQISIARQKARIRESEPVRLYRFEVVRHT